MESVTVEHVVDAPPAAVREALRDIGPFMRAGGYDEVVVDGDRIRIENGVGLLTIELELRIVEDSDAAFAYEQIDGIFETMQTRFSVSAGSDQATTCVTGETTFALDAALVGPILDATIIKRQRRRELAGHFDYLDSAVAD